MILVAGGTGRLGSELVPLLIGEGLRVRVLTRNVAQARLLLGDSVDLVHGDVANAESLARAMAGVDSAVSAVTGFGPGAAGPKVVDFEGNVRLIQAAEAAGVAHFVLMSVQDPTADHPMELNRMKHQAELALRAGRLEWTIIRPTVFMELWAGILGDSIVARGRATVFGRGDNPINFISARDIAQFVALALHDPRLRGQTLEVGGPDNLTLNEVVRAIEAAAGHRADARHIPLPVMRLASRLMRPFRADLAGLIGAGIAMDTRPMGFDSTELARRYPEIVFTRMADVVRRDFAIA